MWIRHIVTLLLTAWIALLKLRPVMGSGIVILKSDDSHDCLTVPIHFLARSFAGRGIPANSRGSICLTHWSLRAPPVFVHQFTDTPERSSQNGPVRTWRSDLRKPDIASWRFRAEAGIPVVAGAVARIRRSRWVRVLPFECRN